MNRWSRNSARYSGRGEQLISDALVGTMLAVGAGGSTTVSWHSWKANPVVSLQYVEALEFFRFQSRVATAATICNRVGELESGDP